MMSQSTDDAVAWPELHRQRRAIVVVDIVESVRLIQHNESDVIDRWRRFVNEVRAEVLPVHGGRLVKSLGDGMLLEFASAPPAVAASIDIQRRIGAYNIGRAEDSRIELRVGAQIADIYIDELDVYGAGVNLAARFATLAGAGEIVVSAQVRDQLVPDLDADIEDLGDCYLKNVTGSTRAFRLSPAKSIPRRSLMNTGLHQPAIAVMPFSAVGGQPEHRVIGEAIADGVCSAICRDPNARVISRLSSSALAERNLPVEDVGRLLGASYVLGGRISSFSGKLSVFAELSDARTGRVVAGDRMLTKVEDVFTASSECIAWVATLAAQGMQSAELELALHKPLPNLESYSLQLGAISMMHRHADQGFDRSRRMLEHLIERHPNLTTPRAWLAKWHVLRVTRGRSLDIQADAALALDQTHRALDIDPGSALCHAVEGFVHCHLRKDLDAAAAAYERALQSNPSEPLAWLYRSVLHAFRAEGEAAISDAEKALSLSPLDPLRYYFDSLAATAAMSAGRFDRALELAERSRRLNRAHSSTWRVIAICNSELGREVEARNAVKELLALEPELTTGRYLDRLPAGLFDIGRQWACALNRAGLPD